jgi:beta-glucosidase
VIKDLLRDSLGFKGIINSDTGPIEMMPWGVEDLTIIQRYQKALEAGVNLFSGTADPAQLLETIRAGKVDMKLIDNSVYRLLMEKFELGLFENPYVDEEKAATIAGSKTFQARADLAMRKSIVLLRNEKNQLPVKPRTKIYFESYFQRRGAASPSNVYPAKTMGDVEFVKTPEEADMILLWVSPGASSLFESQGAPIMLSLSKNAVDVKYINELTAKKPTILAINYTNPWVIDEIYNESTRQRFAGVLATFGTTSDALIDVVTGKFNPSGKMQFSTPVSEEKAQNQLTDVPGYLEGNGYELFKCKEGLSYKKK